MRADATSERTEGLSGRVTRRLFGFSSLLTGVAIVASRAAKAGAAADSPGDTAVAAALAAVANGESVDLPASSSLTAAGIQVAADAVRGKGATKTIITASGSTEVFRLGHVTSPSQWTYRQIADLQINGNGKASAGLRFADATGGQQLAGRWEVARVVVKACSIGISKPSGNIGNVFSAVTVTGCDFGYRAIAQKQPIMHAGCDLFFGGHFDSNALAALYIDSALIGTGGTQLRGTIIEGNPGFGLFVKNWADSFTPLVLDGVWFEANAKAGQVTIDSVQYTPVDMHIENARHVVLINGIVPKVRLINSHLTIENCNINYDTTSIAIDASSTVLARNCHLSGGQYPLLIESIATVARPLGNFASVFYCKPRSIGRPQQGTLLQSNSYGNANSYPFSGTTSVSAISVADGVIFDSCAELTLPPKSTAMQPVVTFTSGKWYLMTVDVKCAKGELADLNVAVTEGGSAWGSLHRLLKKDCWIHLGMVGAAASTFTARLRLANSGSAPIVLRLSALQIMEFDTEPAMLDYYHSGLYNPGTTYPRTIAAAAAPTSGTWAAGDRCSNAEPAAGKPRGWVCTVAGSPGTWISEGNLS
ncbi:MAG: hypothetical protein QM718_07860 [Steroidobacteraceae bacterium]